MGEQRNVTFFHSANAGKTWSVTDYGPAGLFHSASLAFKYEHGIAGAYLTPPLSTVLLSMPAYI
jgi:hypothetical protein